MISLQQMPYLISDLFSRKAGNLLMRDLKSTQPPLNIAGQFQCSYHPYLGLEWCTLDYISSTLPAHLINKNVLTPRIVKHSRGIGHPQVVALFPENWKRREPHNQDSIIYFVNKFVARHLKHTRPVLQEEDKSSVFSSLIELNETQLQVIVANWVHLHENAHRSGPLPLPEYLKIKSSPFTAGLEELRADIHAMITCAQNNFPLSQETFLYILAERLMAYPLFREQNNFDALSSHFFQHKINQKRRFSWKAFSLGEFTELLQDLSREIDQTERSCVRHDPKHQKKILKQYFEKNLVSEESL